MMQSKRTQLRNFAVAACVLLVITLGFRHTDPRLRWKYSTDPNKPRYVFIDLGANGADSLEAFLQHPDAKFHYDFPRPPWAKREDAEIFLFEANPVFNTKLIKAKEKYAYQGINVQLFPSTVVDVEDGIRTFYLDTVNDNVDFWGSSIYANHPDALKSNSTGTRLTSINLSRWLLQNFLPRDYVVIKMDIEGAEYEVVPHMCEMAAYTVVDEMFIEWHAGMIGGTKEENFQRSVIGDRAHSIMVENGVKMPNYISAV
ncbi:hypothetical protein BGZ83_011001 [Gryganskiella cystojenkinii]|nr:hypothetical protein BGZ83_011001 [Gryganskiella cystojenkinii]